MDIFRALYWREFELTVEDCRAYRMRNQYHFTFTVIRRCRLVLG